METLHERLRAIASRSEKREDFWVDFVNSFGLQQIAEIGVYRGNFAQTLLQRCEGLTRYYMVDPWRHLTDWNKPANHPDAQLEAHYRKPRAKTEFAAGKRCILRGKTVDVIDHIPDQTLDFAYIDGDHTLKGITVDLICVYPKVRVEGFLTGDDSPVRSGSIRLLLSRPWCSLWLFILRRRLELRFSLFPILNSVCKKPVRDNSHSWI